MVNLENTKITDLVMTTATVVIMLATSIYTVIAIKQLNVMQQQSNMANKQLQLATESIQSANEAMEFNKEVIKDQTERAERLTNANESLAETSKLSIDTSAKIASKSLNTTIEQFRLDQRAWIGPLSLKWDNFSYKDKIVHIKQGEKFKVGVKFLNSGKTPAYNVHGYIFVKKIPNGQKPIIDQVNREKLLQKTNAIMQPNGTFTLSNASSIYVPTEHDIKSIENGLEIIHIYGEIVYDDVFDNSHYIKYCMFLNDDMNGFSSCAYMNETDQLDFND